MIRHHRTLASIGEQFTGINNQRERFAAAVYAICNSYGTPVLYMSVRIPNLIPTLGHACAIVETHAGDDKLRSAFIDALDGTTGATAGLIAIAHTHPPSTSVQPLAADMHVLPDHLLGVICHRSRHTTVWYDQNGAIDRPELVMPHPDYMVGPTKVPA